MRYELHTAGTRGPSTFMGEFFAYPLARAALEADPEAWAIVPSGTHDELEPFGNLDAVLPRYSGGGVFLRRCGDGVSCLGFEVADRWRADVGAWLLAEGARKWPDDAKALCGTPEAFALYLRTMEAGQAYATRTGRRCPAELIPQLSGLEGKRVEVVDRYGEQRRFIVGKSGGWLPIHLEIERRSCDGGSAVTGAPFQSVRVLN